jgi:hypothetical protein
VRRTVAIVLALAVTGCCRAEPTAPTKVEAAPALWRVDAAHVEAIEATIGEQRITITREGPAHAWCRIASEVPDQAPHVVEFPVEPQAAGELFASVAAPEIRETLADGALESSEELRVTFAGEPARRLIIGASVEGGRHVLDPATDSAYVVADRWWRTLESAQRLLPLRNLVDRRGLQRVTLHAAGRTWALALRDGAWVPEDPQIERARMEPIVLAALRLRPGVFDRTIDPSSLQSVLRLEFEGGAQPQTLELWTAGEDTYFVGSTRALGLGQAHHLDARALAAKVAAL